MADPPKPTPDDDKPRASFTDDDRDFPLPHENRSWITGRIRKTDVVIFPPGTLPTDPNPDSEPADAENKPPDSPPEPPKEQQPQGGTRWPAQYPSQTPKERADSELRSFMPKQLRAEYDKADVDQKEVIWEANKRAFETAKKRKAENLLREAKHMEKVIDLLQRTKEDPGNHHLLPPDDASTSDLKKWYEEMQKPVPPVPHPAPESAQTDNPPTQPKPEDPYSLTSRIMHGDPDQRRRDEEESLRKREELLAREEKLEAQRRTDRVVELTRNPKSASEVMDEFARQAELDRMEKLIEREEALRQSQPITAYASAFKNLHDKSKQSSPPPLFRKRVHSWLQRYAGWAFVGASIGMAGIAEYALAIVLLVVAFVAFAIQIHEWSGHIQRRWLVQLVKGVWCLGVIGMLVFFGAVFYKMGSSKSWSNLLPNNPEDVRPSPTIPTPPPITLIKHSGSVFFATYPQPFMYELGEDSLVPIALDLAVAITNNRGTATRITEYTAEIQTRDGTWHRLPSLPMSPPRTIFFLNRSDIRRGMKCRLEPPAFDAVADRRDIGIGETIEGQMFFELPQHLRYETVSYGKLRVSVSNIQGESSQATFDNPSSAPPNTSHINQGFTWCPGEPNQAIDLSRKLVRPLQE